jgi:hypothetical protein
MVPTHDCPVTCEEHAEKVKQIIVEAFESVGIKPTIKTPDFDLNAQEAR